MADDNVATLMARREYAKAVPLLRREIEKYPSNARLRLQLADALTGIGETEEAASQYEQTAKFYEDNGLVVQAIAVRKKAELIESRSVEEITAADEIQEPKLPPSPLFEDLTAEESAAVAREMVLETYDEGDIVITEGETGSSLYVIVSGEVKVYTRGSRGENVFLAKLTAGDFFGEVRILTGKPRTATVTAAQKSELLRLDKDKLDKVVSEHPRVREILDQFYRRRADQTVEAMIENIKAQRGT
jgi:tetratricopeptide (TPR) repeat protein